MTRARLEVIIDELQGDELAVRDRFVAALHEAAEKVASGAEAGTLHDARGVSVGHFIVWTRGTGTPR